MSQWRLLLIPFGWLYGSIMAIRNWLYSNELLKSLQIPGKSIVVGNLSTGGTGKTPLVDYLLQHFLSQEIKVASLSRGYGRSTKGLVEGDANSTSETIGDEPLLYQFHYGDDIPVVCSEKRTAGVHYIKEKYPDNELIILDDAFQHRKVSAELSILVTEFNRLYSNDHVLPAGNLREFRSGAHRANLVMVSKCPENLSSSQMDEVKRRLKFHNDLVFFSSISYDALTPIGDHFPEHIEHILLVTGIGNPTPLIQHLEKQAKVTHLPFKDHHEFTSKDIEKIHEKFDTFAHRDKVIVTTEKDFMRLRKFEAVYNSNYPWGYQPIKININNEQKFKSLLNASIGQD